MAVRSELLACKDFRSILRLEFERRTKSNRGYSLRAFARDLDVSASRLCDIFAGRYGMRRRSAESIAKALRFSEDEREFFWDLIESECSAISLKRAAALERVKRWGTYKSFNKLSLDSFEIISQWYHFAILELVNVKGFDSTPKSAAQLLGITEDEAHAAIKRLLRVGMLARSENRSEKKLITTDEFTQVGENVPVQAIRNFHKQLIKKAIESIEGQAIDQREISTGVLCVSKSDLPAAKARVKEFKEGFLDPSFSSRQVSFKNIQNYLWIAMVVRCGR